jgi:hypothetical protein
VGAENACHGQRLGGHGHRVARVRRHDGGAEFGGTFLADALAAADRVAAAARLAWGGRTVRVGTAAGLTARLERGIDALHAQHPEFELVLADLPLADRLAALR